MGLGSNFGAPDADWTLPFDAEQESPGVWRVVPKTDLNPGEYGITIGDYRMSKNCSRSSSGLVTFRPSICQYLQATQLRVSGRLLRLAPVRP